MALYSSKPRKLCKSESYKSPEILSWVPFSASRVFPPTSDASEAAPKTTPPSHIHPINQESSTHKGPSTSGHIQIFRYGMEERFAFYFLRTSSVGSFFFEDPCARLGWKTCSVNEKRYLEMLRDN
ncbi:hypothetical protein TNCV_4525891 [Trichonephila clavipes]|nr:hypothetical protein TNCV_4525891 [Trichonephila clavipes]